MSTLDERLISPFGRYFIFAGTGILGSALTLFLPLESMFNPMVADYARIGLFIIAQAAVWFLYDLCPQRIAILLGAICWVAAMVLVYVRIVSSS
jgi:hypothetical protein